MANLKDIATELDVSISLVSKVLNDRLGTTGVRQDLIERIREKAVELDYHKNHNALGLLAGRQNAFAVFVHQHGERGASLVSDFLRGIARTAGDRNLRMLLDFFREREEFDTRLEQLNRGIIDGLIINGVTHPELVPKLLAVQESRFKVVTVYNDPIHPQLPNAGILDRDLTYLTASHLIEQGCRRIVHFAVFPERTEGYRKAHRQRRIEIDEDLVIAFPEDTTRYVFSADKVANTINKLLDDGILFDGICAQSDQQAIAAINTLFRRGVSIPEDVKITGVDDSPAAEVCIVPLTSVSQNYDQRGVIAVEMLEEAVTKGPPKSISLEPQLFVRESSGG